MFKIKFFLITLIIYGLSFLDAASFTSESALQELINGNLRFVSQKLINIDYHAQIESTKDMQKPHSIILTCMDSRVPPEIIFDQGIGNIFVVRNAGNIEDKNVLGSMEYAVKFAGAKLIVVLGHSNCGAVTGAVKGVKNGNLTQIMQRIEPCIPENTHESLIVEKTTINNIYLTIDNILKESKTINELYQDKQIGIVPAFYDLASGEVRFLDNK